MDGYKCIRLLLLFDDNFLLFLFKHLLKHQDVTNLILVLIRIDSFCFVVTLILRERWLIYFISHLS